MNHKLIFLLATLIPAWLYCQSPDEMKLKDYHPVSIYKIPITLVQHAKFRVIDMHSHDYPKSDSDLDKWVRTMNEAGIQKTMILTYSTGARFDSIVQKYARYRDKFVIWCGFDYTGLDQPGWKQHALAEL